MELAGPSRETPDHLAARTALLFTPKGSATTTGGRANFPLELESTLRELYAPEIMAVMEASKKVTLAAVRRQMADVVNLFPGLPEQQVRDKLYTITIQDRRALFPGQSKGGRVKNTYGLRM